MDEDCRDSAYVVAKQSKPRRARTPAARRRHTVELASPGLRDWSAVEGDVLFPACVHFLARQFRLVDVFPSTNGEGSLL